MSKYPDIDCRVSVEVERFIGTLARIDAEAHGLALVASILDATTLSGDAKYRKLRASGSWAEMDACRDALRTMKENPNVRVLWAKALNMTTLPHDPEDNK